MAEPRILFWDLETSHNVAAVFKLFGEDYINHANLLMERYIICASWKWMDKGKIHSISVLDDAKRYAKDPHDDTYVCEQLHRVLSAADVIVAHNGDSFDTKYVETRMLFHGLSPLPPITSIDTCKVARNRFMFNSNKLDYIARFLKVGKKVDTTPGLWLRVLNGEKSAVKEMISYNKVDVGVLEQVFYKLRPYMPNHINRELFGGVGCPRCGSTKFQSRGTHKAISRVYRRYQCQNPICMGWFKEQKAEKPTTRYRVL